jgi:hypothetical protein
MYIFIEKWWRGLGHAQVRDTTSDCLIRYVDTYKKVKKEGDDRR